MVLWYGEAFEKADDIPKGAVVATLMNGDFYWGTVQRIPKRSAWVMFEGQCLLGPNKRLDRRLLTVPMRVRNLWRPYPVYHSHWIFPEQEQGLRAITLV